MQTQKDGQGKESWNMDFLDTVNNISNLPVILAGTASFNEIDDPCQYSGGQRH
ncbi:MAG: hypothetical protein IPN88_10730 [Bacteroidetes bacterium]|nr:hypothetical protein [Bacteroidota bacterium]